MRAYRGESFSHVTLWIGKERVDRLAIATSSRPIHDSEGHFTGAVIAFHDITELMRALRVEDDFITLVSHELRNPLTSIMGYLEMVDEFEDELPPLVVRHLSVASRNADRLLRLVSDLLTASLSGGDTAVPLNRVPFDLSTLVQHGVDDIAQRLEIAGLDLRLDIDPEVHVVADPGRLSQVIDNLLSNALKYSLPGGTIDVALSKREGVVRIDVSDTGIGISEPDQQHLFTKFFRARNATEAEIPGIGLGLAISRAIVEAHAGRIVLTSQEGRGTSVHVTLPDVSPGAGGSRVAHSRGVPMSVLRSSVVPTNTDTTEDP